MAKTIGNDGGREVQLATRIPQALHRRLRIVSIQHGKAIMEIVREALEPVVAKLEREVRRTA
jgi:predicted DNA-binding protein